MNKHLRLLSLLGAVLIAGCGGGSSSDDDGGGGVIPNPPVAPPSFPPQDPPGTNSLALTSHGGVTAGSSVSSGGRGGNLIVASAGSVYVGVTPSPVSPPMPAAPPTGIPVTSWLDEQTINGGDAILTGTVTAQTSGSGATLNVTNGDLVIQGDLRSADNGATETDLIINAPAGTVWILGSIRTGQVDGSNSGDAGGTVRITAQRIIFSGSIETRGEDQDGAADNRGGDVIFDTSGSGTGQLLFGGTINLSGGDSSGADTSGGDGGSFQTYFPSDASGGSVYVTGTTIITNGGSASGSGTVSGGHGGDLDLQANAGVFFRGTWSGVGGNATSSSAGATGGTGGRLLVNTRAIFDSGPVSVFGSINATGGSGNGPSGFVAGGAGGDLEIRGGSDINLGAGTLSLKGANSAGRAGGGGDAFFTSFDEIYFEATIDCSDGSSPLAVIGEAAGKIDFKASHGDIQLGGSFISNGGNGSATDIAAGPTDGGTIGAQTGSGGGSITLLGSIQANGGSDNNPADDNHGALGGSVRFVCINPAGSIYLDPGTSIQLDGGNAGGASASAFGGGGGSIELLTGGGSIASEINGGNISLRGAINARGGNGLTVAGSAGGLGGSVLANTDTSGDGRGGDITLGSGATIDVSGGAGAVGGDARHGAGSFAVIFDADGADSNDGAENGVVKNFGMITAHGGVSNGDGGDVLFDGLSQPFSVGPASGNIQLQYDGAGSLGQFFSQ